MDINVSDWMDDVAKPGMLWFIKRLSGNDTLANGSHQAGPYIPRELIFKLLPQINCPSQENPDTELELSVDSDSDCRNVRVVWYNNRVSGSGTRNEVRFTRLGGRNSPLLDPESTGALTIFAFELDQYGNAERLSVWVSRNALEEDVIEEVVGSVLPGQWKLWSLDEKTDFQLALFPETQSFNSLVAELPEEWMVSFPTAQELVAKSAQSIPGFQFSVDERLMKRRALEFQYFRILEKKIELARVREGYETVDGFISHAQSVLQRRRVRSGRSLELHLRTLFLEENLAEDYDFSYRGSTENGNTPDFLFPSQDCYHQSSWPQDNLRMLAVKTSCRDRWKQVLNEAKRLPRKHLFTLQEGVSLNQFRQMREAGVDLVIPESRIQCFSTEIQPYLITLESFLGDVRLLRL